MSKRAGGSPWLRRPPAKRPTRGAAQPRSVLPSLNFLVLLLVFLGSGLLLLHNELPGRGTVIVFVLSGWVVSLCLHEFGHALTAWLGGDRAVADTGYLDLDPMRYTDPALSLILPIAFIVLGGFGLPGGAVWIDTAALRSRLWASAVSAAGPVMNLACLAVLGLFYASLPDGGTTGEIAAGTAVLAYFQATAIILNLVPIPGLDGFGILRPWLRGEFAVKADAVGAAGFLVLSLLLWFTSAGATLSRAALRMTDGFGFDIAAVASGFGMMKIF